MGTSLIISKKEENKKIDEETETETEPNPVEIKSMDGLKKMHKETFLKQNKNMNKNKSKNKNKNKNKAMYRQPIDESSSSERIPVNTTGEVFSDMSTQEYQQFEKTKNDFQFCSAENSATLKQEKEQATLLVEPLKNFETCLENKIENESQKELQKDFEQHFDQRFDQHFEKHFKKDFEKEIDTDLETYLERKKQNLYKTVYKNTYNNNTGSVDYNTAPNDPLQRDINAQKFSFSSVDIPNANVNVNNEAPISMLDILMKEIETTEKKSTEFLTGTIIPASRKTELEKKTNCLTGRIIPSPLRTDLDKKLQHNDDINKEKGNEFKRTFTAESNIKTNINTKTFTNNNNNISNNNNNNNININVNTNINGENASKDNNQENKNETTKMSTRDFFAKERTDINRSKLCGSKRLSGEEEKSKIKKKESEDVTNLNVTVTAKKSETEITMSKTFTDRNERDSKNLKDLKEWKNIKERETENRKTEEEESEVDRRKEKKKEEEKEGEREREIDKEKETEKEIMINALNEKNIGIATEQRENIAIKEGDENNKQFAGPYHLQLGKRDNLMLNEYECTLINKVEKNKEAKNTRKENATTNVCCEVKGVRTRRSNRNAAIAEINNSEKRETGSQENITQESSKIVVQEQEINKRNKESKNNFINRKELKTTEQNISKLINQEVHTEEEIQKLTTVAKMRTRTSTGTGLGTRARSKLMDLSVNVTGINKSSSNESNMRTRGRNMKKYIENEKQWEQNCESVSSGYTNNKRGRKRKTENEDIQSIEEISNKNIVQTSNGKKARVSRNRYNNVSRATVNSVWDNKKKIYDNTIDGQVDGQVDEEKREEVKEEKEEGEKEEEEEEEEECKEEKKEKKKKKRNK